MINPGMVLNGRYQLDKQIGEGGFATVFLATDLQLGRKVAVKILSSQMSQDPEFLGRFKQEARSIASFEHPHILSVYDYGEFQGDPYLVMPFIDGGTLQDRLRRGPLPTDEAARLLEQLGSALDYAHDRGVVHRDIKPQNMLMRSDGRVMLTDFGIAKLLTSDSTNSMTRPMGTISYMAPEQFDGHVSRQSDVYALGVVLYQMVSGQLPFTGTTSQVLSGHYQKPVPSLVGQPALQSLSPASVRKIDEVIQKAMAKNGHDRYRTASEFANAFRSAVSAAAPASAMAETELATPLVSKPTEVVSPISTPTPVPPPAGYPPPAQGYPPPAYPQQPSQPYQPMATQPNYQTPSQPNYVQPMNYTPPAPPSYQQQPPMVTQPQPFPPGPYMPQPQPPAKKSNTALFAIIGGVAAIAIIAAILIVVLGNSPKPVNTTPTAVAATTPTIAATTSAATTAATSAAATTATRPVLSLTTAASGTAGTLTTAAATTQAVTTQAVNTTAAPTTAPATTARPTSTPTPRATTAAPTTTAAGIKAPDGYTVYKNTDKLNLEIAYPNGWKPTLSDDGLSVTISDGTSNFIVLRDPTATTSGTVEEYNAQFVDGLKKDGWTPKTEAARLWGFAGEIWLQSSYQKDARRAWGLFALHRGVPYAVVLTGDNSTFDDRLDKEFSKMFNNMHFFGTSVDYFTGEVKTFKDPKGNYIINYPIDKWEFNSSTSVPYVAGKDNKAAQYYMYDVAQSSLGVTELLTVYKDKLANAGVYENLKETDRYKLLTFDKDNSEQSIRFSYTYKGATYVGELLIHKRGNLAYVFVTVADQTSVLDDMYFDLWRYTQFLK